MPLSDVMHQDAAIDRLCRALGSGRVPHAYLFTGPPGVGKEMLACRFGQFLLCAAREEPSESGLFPTQASSLKPQALSDSCGHCEDCRLMAAGTHPDYHRIHRTLNKMHPEKKVRDRKAIYLGVDVIRHFLIDQIALRPGRGRAKVFIIVEAERLNDEAQNAMLKTLEEPPGHSYLILLATSPDTLLPTTRSRCHHVPMRSLPTPFVAEQVCRRLELSEDHARFLAELSGGSLGLAIRYGQAGLHGMLDEIVTTLKGAPSDPLACGKALADLAKQISSADRDDETDDEGDTNAARDAQNIVLAMVSTVLRDLERAAVGHPSAALPAKMIPADLIARASPRTLGESIRAVAAAEYQVGRNANANLIFDALGIALGRGFSGQPAVAGR